MKAIVRHSGNMSFIGKSESNHWVIMDTTKKIGGEEASVRPMELILIGLGGCTGVDVISILNKMRVKLDKFEVNIEAEQAEDYPKVFKKIHIEYIFHGKDLKKENLERAIKLSQEKYCSVSAMLRNTAELTYSYKIIE